MTGSRGTAVDAAAEGVGVDAVLVTDPHDLRWLTGFTGSSGLALAGPGTRLFITDFRYVEQSADQLESGFERVVCDRNLRDPLPGWLGDRALRLGFNEKQLTVAERDDLATELGDRVDLVPVGGLVGRLRERKDGREIGLIQEAARIADEALSSVLAQGLVGRTEAEVAWAIESAIRDAGGEGISFPPIVASGAHGALPHAEPRDRPIPKGELVTIDWGAVHEGYCSDCTRTVATGSVPALEREIHALVLQAEQAGVDAVRAGPTGSDVDSVARGIITDAGYGEQFGHGLGHGVGLEVHEGPSLGRLGDRSLEPGMVVTVEPGVYLSGRCGVRIEDLVVVEEVGARVLTSLPRELIEVD